MKLSPEQIALSLQNLPQWSYQDNTITREYSFADFGDAMVFVNRVAELAEEHGHHPDIDIRYNRVKIVLTTHDASGLTKKDFALAQQIEEITAL